MKIAGIVTEYNPFHLGHEFQIQKTREELGVDHVIVVMSGHFVQRGEPALLDKWERTKLALAGGADLVIELPTPYACSSAELFAKGAVSLLNHLQCVDYLVFGSEHGELGPLFELASFLNHEPANYKNALHSELKAGNSFPKARSNAIKATFNDHSDLLKGSNNILAIEYIRSLLSLNSRIQPFTLKRKGSSYLNEQLATVLPSATAIRKHLYNNRSEHSDNVIFNNAFLETLEHALPQTVLDVLKQEQHKLVPVFMEQLYPILQYLLLTSTSQDIEAIYDFPEELYYRLLKKSTQHTQYADFIEDAMSKNFTKAMIQRSLIHLYLKLTPSDITDLNANGNYHHYIRLLGVKKHASGLIRHIKEHADINVITNFKDDLEKLPKLGQSLLLKENMYTNLYHQLTQSNRVHPQKDDYRQKIIIHNG